MNYSTLKIFIPYLTPYILFLLISTLSIQLLSFFYHKGIYLTCKIELTPLLKYSFIALFILFLILFSAFRVIEYPREPIYIKHGVYHILQGGTDAPQYKYIYDSCANLDFREFVSTRLTEEYLYLFSNWFFSHVLKVPFTIFLGFYYLFFSLCCIKLAKWLWLDSQYFLGLLCILTMYLVGFNIFRQTIAIFFSIYIIEALLQNKLVKSFFLICIGIGFHSTTIIFIVPLMGFLLFKNRVYEKEFLILFIIIACVGAIFLGQSISLLQIRHSSDGLNGKPSIFWLATFCFLILLYNRKEMYCSQNEKKLYFISLCFTPIFIFQTYWQIAYRFMLFSKPIVYILLIRLSKYKINVLDNILNLIIDIIFLGVIASFFLAIHQVGLPYESYLFK